jgi:tripartite-type tricarboxylate transporter receptor subunit TctC
MRVEFTRCLPHNRRTLEKMHQYSVHPDRRNDMKVFWRTAALLCALGMTQSAWAQSFPSKPVRIVVGFPAGGPIDIVARLISPKLGEVLGQQVVIDNRGGANGLIAGDLVAKSPPDGYTMMLISTGTVAISPHIYPKMPYDPLRDLVCVTLVTQTGELLVVHPSLPVKSVKELIALAKARPGEISIASTGSGGLPHLALELLKMEAKVNILHVPFNGAAPAVTNAVGGQVQGVIADLPVLQPHIQSGRLRALAFAAPKRSPLFSNVPTMIEQGLPKVEAVNWYGIQIAAKTPPEIIARLNEAFAKTLNDPDMRQKLIGRGADPIPGSSADFTAFVKAEYDKWGPIAKASGAKVD